MSGSIENQLDFYLFQSSEQFEICCSKWVLRTGTDGSHQKVRTAPHWYGPSKLSKVHILGNFIFFFFHETFDAFKLPDFLVFRQLGFLDLGFVSGLWIHSRTIGIQHLGVHQVIWSSPLPITLYTYIILLPMFPSLLWVSMSCVQFGVLCESGLCFSDLSPFGCNLDTACFVVGRW